MTTPTKRGAVDGGFGRGIPLGGRDDRPATGYRSTKKDGLDDDETITDEVDLNDFDDPDEAESAADRRRDPLRR
jgi:hypothetical protein